MDCPRPIGIKVKVTFDDEYLQSTNIAYELIRNSDTYPHRILFAMSLKAYFEYCCNTAIVDYAEKRVEEARRKNFIKDVQWWNSYKKITQLVYELSNGAYTVQEDHATIVNLRQFIVIRNGIEHKVDEYLYVDGKEVPDTPCASVFSISTIDPFIGQLDSAMVETCYKAIMEFTKAVRAIVAKTDPSEYDFILPAPTTDY